MADPRVVVGSVWRHSDGKDYTVKSIDNDPNWPVNPEPLGAAALDMREFTYISGPTPPKVEPPDWNRWLPPEPLPDTGPKEWKAGQIWAYRGPHDNAVFRVRTDGERNHDCLASASWPVLIGSIVTVSDDGYGRYAILVQDVGEPAPRDPDVLYGRAPAVPMALVGETWRLKCGCVVETAAEEQTGRFAGYFMLAKKVNCKSSDATHYGWHPKQLAAEATRISPAPQQPAPAAAPAAPRRCGCFYAHAVGFHENGCPRLAALASRSNAAAPAVVPEAPTEPAQLPDVRRLVHAVGGATKDSVAFDLCHCSICQPPRVIPFVPSVDDWDLLPDVVASPRGRR